MSAIRLEHLGEETWGHKLRRARERDNWTLKGAAHLLCEFQPTSQSTLQRLERLDRAPKDVNRRTTAVLALTLYGVDPADFDLSLDDLPARLLPDLLGAWGGKHDPGRRHSNAALAHAADLLDAPPEDLPDEHGSGSGDAATVTRAKGA